MYEQYSNLATLYVEDTILYVQDINSATLYIQDSRIATLYVQDSKYTVHIR